MQARVGFGLLGMVFLLAFAGCCGRRVCAPACCSAPCAEPCACAGPAPCAGPCGLPANAECGETWCRCPEPAVIQHDRELVIQPPCCRPEIVAPVHRRITHVVQCRKATCGMVRQPAKYEWVRERVVVKPVTWDVHCVPGVDCCCRPTMCKACVPTCAQLGWKWKRVCVRPEITDVVWYPASYRNVTQCVVTRPGATNCVLEPGRSDSIYSCRLVRPAQCVWRKVTCEAPAAGPVVVPSESPAPAPPPDAPPSSPASDAPPTEEPAEGKGSSRVPSSGELGVPPAVAASR